VTSAREVVLFVNRRAGTGSGHRLVSDLEGLLKQYGYDVTMIDTIAGLAPHVSSNRSQIHAVIAAGGDGTAETVVNATDADVPIAIFPLGTENLLAKYLRIEAHPRRLVEMISLRKTVQIDAGRANGKLFLLMLSCGFDADVVRRVHEERQGNISHLAYAKPIVDSIWNYDYPNLRVAWETDAGWKELDCHWAFAFNTPSYAAGLQIVSEADPSDGEFEIATFAGGSFWHGLWQFSAVVLGQHYQLPDFKLNRSNRIRISSDRENVAYQVDGDPGGFLPVEIEVLPKHLTLIVDEDR
jgi:diacylglycerol kinase family enzyme